MVPVVKHFLLPSGVPAIGYSPALSREQRRFVALSIITLRFALPSAAIWVVASWLIGSVTLTIGSCLILFCCLIGYGLHMIERHEIAKLVWLGGTSCSLAYGATAVDPAGGLPFIFVPLAVLPFLLYSLRRQRLMLWGMTALPLVLWLASFRMLFLEDAVYEVSAHDAALYLAPGVAVTCSLHLLQIMGYFVLAMNKDSAELVKARRQAERASAAKTLFLKNISHEMRTPLNVIAGYTSLTKSECEAGQTPANDTLVERLDLIENAAETLQSGITNMIAYSELSSYGTARLLPVRVSKMFQELSRDIEMKRKAKNQNIVIEADPVIKVQADPRLLREALAQLLDNAVRFAPEGSTVTMRAQRGAEGRVQILIEDEGPGIPPGKISKAFQPFERLAEAQGTRLGAGIGLSIAHRSAEVMGAGLHLKPSNVGTHMCIELAEA
ncbi:Signal transduction histidine kinase [Roseovarius litoreus]|uniref:histidine kinase n=1 Tax=Roseovarius litoreus TaxID=1155722 RepID=A0A1M7CNM3_9RHOB|nr:Signal transduction histidine kinase [Roseovarius litoreus]